MQVIGRGHSKRGVALAAAAMLALGSACVSSGKYERIEQEKAGLQNDLEALDRQHSELTQAEASLRQKLEQREQEVARLRGTYDDLVTALKEEISSGQVQIKQLKNGIRLNVANEILFPSGSVQLDAKGSAVIDPVSSQIAESPNRVEVIGIAALTRVETDGVPRRCRGFEADELAFPRGHELPPDPRIRPPTRGDSKEPP